MAANQSFHVALTFAADEVPTAETLREVERGFAHVVAALKLGTLLRRREEDATTVTYTYTTGR